MNIYIYMYNMCIYTYIQPYTTDIRNDIKLDYRKYLYKVDTSREHTLYFKNVDGPWLTNLNTPEIQVVE